jgi:hypothetical protein
MNEAVPINVSENVEAAVETGDGQDWKSLEKQGRENKALWVILLKAQKTRKLGN